MRHSRYIVSGEFQDLFDLAQNSLGIDPDIELISNQALVFLGLTQIFEPIIAYKPEKLAMAMAIMFPQAMSVADAMGPFFIPPGFIN